MKEKKKQLRKSVAIKKKQYQQEKLSCWSYLLFEQLETHPLFQKAEIILLYHSLPDEVQTHEIIEKWATRKTILLPVVKGDYLELHPYTDNSHLHAGAFQILEPDSPCFTDYEKIELALIPGVAFDRKGNRLGRGKGFYDRLLPSLAHSYKIGICFNYQTFDTIPCEAFDQPMDEVWTENGRFDRR